MELARMRRRAGIIGIIGFGTVALWLGSLAIWGMPRTVHAQDDSAVSNDNGVSDDATEPDAKATPIDINGEWTGSATDKKTGESGTLTLNLSQTDKVITASWELTFGTTTAGGNGSGKINGKSLKLVLFDPTISDKCRADISAKVGESDDVADSLDGTFSVKKCFSKTVSGKLDLAPTATPSPTP